MHTRVSRVYLESTRTRLMVIVNIVCKELIHLFWEFHLVQIVQEEHFQQFLEQSLIVYANNVHTKKYQSKEVIT